MVRNISRRLARLEARVRPASDSFSILIQFVDAEKRVTTHSWWSPANGGRKCGGASVGTAGGRNPGRSSDVWPTASIGASRQRTGTYDAKEKQRVPPGKHPEITRNPRSQGTPKLAGPLSVAGEWHDLVDGGPLKPAALCASGGEQRLQLARETARPGANWPRGPFPKAGREFRPPGEAEAGIGGGAGCGRGLGPHAPRVGGTVRWFCEIGSP